MAIRPVYSKLVLPSRKSLEIISNIKFFFFFFNGGCPLIRACSLIRSNTVCYSQFMLYYLQFMLCYSHFMLCYSQFMLLIINVTSIGTRSAVFFNESRRTKVPKLYSKESM